MEKKQERKTLNLKDVISQKEYESLLKIAKKNRRSITGQIGFLVAEVIRQEQEQEQK